MTVTSRNLRLLATLTPDELVKACRGCQEWKPALHPRDGNGKFVRTSGRGDEKRGKARANERRARRRRAATGAGVVAGVALAAMMAGRNGPPPPGQDTGEGPGRPSRPGPRMPLALGPGPPPPSGGTRPRPGDRFAQHLLGVPHLGEPEPDLPFTRHPRPKPEPSERPTTANRMPKIYTVPGNVAGDAPTRPMRRDAGRDAPTQRVRRPKSAGEQPSAEISRPVRGEVENTVRLSAQDVLRGVADATVRGAAASMKAPRGPRQLTERERATSRQILAWVNSFEPGRRVTSKEIRENYDEWLALFQRGQLPLW